MSFTMNFILRKVIDLLEILKSQGREENLDAVLQEEGNLGEMQIHNMTGR